MKVLLASYGGAHISAILPVWRELSARGHEPVLLAMTTAKAAAEREGIPCVTPAQFVDPADIDIRRWGERLAERHHTEGKGMSRDESIAYLGVSFRDLARDLGEDAAWDRYDVGGLWAFTPTDFLEEVLSQIRPDAVIATTSPRMERAALRAAFRRGLPSLCMVELFGIQEEPWLSRPDNGDLAAVSRPDTADRLVAAGRHRAAIVLTGSPMFDQLANPALPAAGRTWRHERGVADDRKLVFWAEQPEPSDAGLPRRIRAHLSAVCQARGWQLVVRLHPSSTDPAVEVIEKGVLQSHADEPLTHVIHAADVAVTLTSTVGMEVLLSGKPLLVPRISANAWMAPYGDGDGALAVQILEDVERGLTVLLGGGPETAGLAELRARLPAVGGAAARVADLIESDRFRLRRLPYGPA